MLRRIAFYMLSLGVFLFTFNFTQAAGLGWENENFPNLYPDLNSKIVQPIVLGDTDTAVSDQAVYKEIEGQVNQTIYVGLNRVVASSGRSGTGLEKVKMTFYPLTGTAASSCVYDLVAGSNDCAGQVYVSTVTPLAKGQAVISVNLGLSGKALEKVDFTAYYSATTNPSGYTLNIGDSIGNDGWGGDGGQQSFDAELQIYNTTLDVFGNDWSSGKVVDRKLVHLSDNIQKGAVVSLTVKNKYISWNVNDSIKDSLTSDYLFALASTATEPPSTTDFVVTLPQAGEVWRPGETHTISWAVPASMVNYLRYLKAVHVPTGGTMNIIDGNNLNLLGGGSMNWTIPADWPIFGQFKIRVGVQPEGGDRPYADSGVITIESAAPISTGITVTGPKAGEVWRLGEKRIITWQAASAIDAADKASASASAEAVKTVTILLSPPQPTCTYSNPPCMPAVAQSYEIATAAPDIGTYTWTVPEKLAETYQGMQVITVRSNESNISGQSAKFTLGNKPVPPTPNPTPVPAPTPGPVPLPGIPEISAEAVTVKQNQTQTLSGVDEAKAKELLARADDIVKKIKALQLELAELKPQLEAIKEFVAFGTQTTAALGEGERAGVVASFTEVFGKAPESEVDWEDIIKIANGRWPSVRNDKKELEAEAKFKLIYKREVERDLSKYDDAAIVVMTYGLRPANRNLVSEAAAIKTFQDVFKTAPVSAADWDTVRAIAYSGASRELKATNEPDADQDGLSNDEESKYGTNPNLADTDGDGYTDGVEVNNGYDPLGPNKLIR